MRIYKHIVTNEFYINVAKTPDLVKIDVGSFVKAFDAGLIDLGNIIGSKILVVDNNRLFNVGDIAENQEELTLPFFASKTKKELLIELFNSTFFNFETKIDLIEQLRSSYIKNWKKTAVTDNPSLYSVTFRLNEREYLNFTIDENDRIIAPH